MASRIQDMDAKDDADITAIHLWNNDALNATVEGHVLLGVKSAIDKIKHDHDLQETNTPTGPAVW